MKLVIEIPLEAKLEEAAVAYYAGMTRRLLEDDELDANAGSALESILQTGGSIADLLGETLARFGIAVDEDEDLEIRVER